MASENRSDAISPRKINKKSSFGKRSTHNKKTEKKMKRTVKTPDTQII